jgi:hypothetical protein
MRKHKAIDANTMALLSWNSRLGNGMLTKLEIHDWIDLLSYNLIIIHIVLDL